MDVGVLWSIIAGGAAAVAGMGAWGATAYGNRFIESWQVEDRGPGVYFLRNNTRRNAEMLESEATQLTSTRTATFELTGQQSATIRPGEGFGVILRDARGIKITWTRKTWWGKTKTHVREVTLAFPVRTPHPQKPSLLQRIFRG